MEVFFVVGRSQFIEDVAKLHVKGYDQDEHEVEEEEEFSDDEKARTAPLHISRGCVADAHRDVKEAAACQARRQQKRQADGEEHQAEPGASVAAASAAVPARQPQRRGGARQGAGQRQHGQAALGPPMPPAGMQMHQQPGAWPVLQQGLWVPPGAWPMPMPGMPWAGAPMAWAPYGPLPPQFGMPWQGMPPPPQGAWQQPQQPPQ